MTIIKTLLFFTFINASSLAVDFGNGSDGVCNLNAAINTDTKNTYNCTSATISNISVTGAKSLTIKSLGSITFTGVLSLDGGLGGAGQASNPSVAGGAGPGGYSGGLSNANQTGGEVGESGGRNAEGQGGDVSLYRVVSTAGGAGGGGAIFGTATLPTSGANSIDDLGALVLGGAAGADSYSPESGFENNLVGGAGGGAGSSGTIHPAGTEFSGGAGGGGGGAIRIVAKVDIIVELAGGISSDGGDGGDGAGTVSGGGGGGSGGAIFLQAEGDIRINGTVSATGGSGGAGHAIGDGGAGGNGGSGRIRYDDSDGVITGTGTTTPTAVINTIQISGSESLQSYDSSISCGAIGLSEKDKAIYSFTSLLLLFLVGNIISKKSHYI